MSLESDLRRIPGVYADLEDALVPGRSLEPPDSSPDPRNRPAPAKLNVADHRHKLMRGLRWWVDAVHPREGKVPRVGQDVALMCGALLAALPVMEEEDRATLHSNLQEWLLRSWELLGDGGEVRVGLPAAAMDQRVRVADAARMLGCTVRTIQRRVPAERRPGGMVLLREVWRCDLCELPHGECAHTATVAVV
ncbi:hypothetical protein ACJ5H2_13435 [Nocardioides sp. R1-1]|uniref:hypothetical protein n=1 Tax=Nocardioides sp. R1-1 TaxID=3383502 RepID=UPI0038CF2DD2